VTKDNLGVCTCGDCKAIALTDEQVEVCDANWVGLVGRVHGVFELHRDDTRFPMQRVWPLGFYGGRVLRIILVVLPDRRAFDETAARLVATVPGPFVTVTPTLRHDDTHSKQLLGSVKSGLISLESNVEIPDDDWLNALASADELFSPFLPANDEPLETSEAARPLPGESAPRSLTEAGSLETAAMHPLVASTRREATNDDGAAEKPPGAAEIQVLGRLRYLPGFADLWVGADHYDLRERTKARLCIQFLVESKAVDAESARHLTDEIDPYVRAHGNFPRLSDIKIQDYFNAKRGNVPRLCKDLIVAVARSRRYFLKVD
jgi:hypothetical protein